MTSRRRPAAIAIAVLASVLLVGPVAEADAPSRTRSGNQRAVFVQTNDPTGNEIVAYRRGPGGALHEAGSFPTGDLGGIAKGAVSDPLASQGSLTYDRRHSLLFAVNAGSDTITVFEVDGVHLDRVQTLPSRGRFPASIAVHQRLVYVLNAGSHGKVFGYRIGEGRLHPLEGSARSLGLSNTNPPDFESSPGQVGFSPDGRELIVTTKGNGTIEVFRIRANGRPSARSVSTPNDGVPFAFLFDPAGRLLVAEAAGALTAYQLHQDRSLSVVSSVPNGQIATCWIVSAKGYLFVSNTGSDTLSGYAQAPDGTLSLTTSSGIAALTDAGPIDMAVTRSESILFLQNGADQTIQSFRVRANGTLRLLETTPGPPATNGVPFEGIVAT